MQLVNQLPEGVDILVTKDLYLSGISLTAGIIDTYRDTTGSGSRLKSMERIVINSYLLAAGSQLF